MVSSENIEVNRNHTNVEFCGQFYNSVDVLETNIANVFGHKLNIMCLEVFKTYFDSRFSSPYWHGSKEVNGEQFPIHNVSWIGNLQSGTEVHFATENNVVYRTEVYAIEFSSPNFVVFTTNAAGTKRYFVFR